MESSSVSLLIKQIDDKWPNRNKDSDVIEASFLSFSTSLDENKDSAKIFVDELIDLAKNGKDDERISWIIYDGMYASGEKKDKFWKWQKHDDPDNGRVNIYFNLDNAKKNKRFDIPALKKPKRVRRGPNAFPGSKVLQFKKRNKSVEKMQKQLMRHGFYMDQNEIGYYGLSTCFAVSQYYQKALGIHSGDAAKHGNKLGPKAWERLFEDAVGN